MKYEPPPPAKFPWRWVLYGSLTLYLFADLHLLHGPLRRHVEARRDPPPEAVGPMRWVASVNGKPITYAQLQRGVEIYLWRRGESVSDVSYRRLQLIEQTVRERLIARELISIYTRSNPLSDFNPGVAKREYELFKTRFEDSAFKQKLDQQELTEAQLIEQFEDELHETEWIDAKTASAFAVSDQEVRSWFERNGRSMKMPARTRASHIFLTTHRLTAAEIANARTRLEQAREKIQSGELEFAQAAADISEDERTKANGGDLGYFTDSRVPDGFAQAVGELEAGVISQPIRSEIGWHLIRVDQRLPARNLTFDEAAPEIRAFLESQKRRKTVMTLIREREINAANVRRFPIHEQENDSEAGN